MAKGSVRKKGKKWYYRFYVEDASGKMVQKEYAGTESKSETEKLLRKALEDYEDKKFVAKADNLTVGELLDMWAEEELKTGTLSNGTVENYLSAIRCTKKHPIADRKLKTVTAEHLQAFLDLLTFGGEFPDGKVRKGYSKDYIHSFSAVLQQSERGQARQDLRPDGSAVLFQFKDFFHSFPLSLITGPRKGQPLL